MDQVELQSQLDQMEKSLETPDTGFEELRTDSSNTDSPGTQAPGTDSPGTDAPETQTPSTEVPEEDPRDAELRKLREELDEFKSKKVTTKAPPTKAPVTELPINDEDFVGDVDLDELTRDPKIFNQLLNKIYKKAREDARQDIRFSSESVVRSVPDIVKNSVAITAKLQETQKKFYEENADLVPWKQAVATVFQEKMVENPSKRYDELLPEVATEVRKRIGLRKEVDNKGKETPPKLPSKGKNSQRKSSTPDLTLFEKELNEMDKALNNY